MNTALLLASLGLGLTATPDSGPAVDYNREVKPLLAKYCVSCHGEARPRGGLRLDTARFAIQGGKAGPSIVAGSADDSPIIEAVLGEGSTERMPLKRLPLSEAEIAILRTWIDQGAHSPSDEVPTRLVETHWAFVPPKRPTIPDVSRPDWPDNPIDAFILGRLDKDHLAPSPEADRATLIRRVSLDLVGLPPTPEEVADFVADTRPDAYERVVDRLLASPHFGERWARPWLDIARYADSNGYSIDAPRSIWKYRDWVIEAFNRDLPFDEFVTDQIAGDLKPNASVEQKVATGFHRNTQINQEGGIDPEQFRVEAVDDRVATTGTAFLGMTIGCAQCHDHKYDPISHREYYSLFAFFNSVDEPEIEFATDAEKARRDALHVEIKADHRKLSAEHPDLLAKQREWESQLSPAFKVNLSPELKDAFDRLPENRTESQKHGITELFLAARPEYKAEHKALVALRAKEPKFVTSLIVHERETPRPTFIHLGGDFTRKGASVTPDVPKVLPPLKPRVAGKPDRLDLARWLVDPANPLTARVTVNRVWQAYFGRGIVETDNDFGTQGAPPSHPELLDWLALELIGRGWSLKAIHRTIVTSQTYRQSSNHRSDLDRVDPGNRLLGRQSRIRLDAELIRDSALSVSGLLTPKVGGPSVFPPQPDGVMNLGQMRRPWTTSTGPDRYRRGLYTFFWRATPNPSLIAFDAPNAIQSCTRRNRSNTPIQALTLLNDLAYVECATAVAARTMTENRSDDLSRIAFLFQTCLGRSPTDREAQTILVLLAEERAEACGDLADTTAWTTAARVVLNLDEFITRE